MPTGSFLSPANYDDDASSIHSERSDQDTDSEDDEVLMGARTSAEIREHDRSVFTEEEERDKLLEDSRRRERRGSAMSLPKPLKKLFSQSYTHLPGLGSSEHVNEIKGNGSGKRDRRRRRRERRERRSEKKERLIGEAEHGERRELMYEMEEGGMKEGSSTGSSSDAEGSDEIDRRGLLGLQDDKSTRTRQWRRWCFIHLLIAVGFSILVLVAWKLSLNRKGIKYNQKIMSNGTALFAPTTILISLDGFRADFLNRGLTPRLNAFVKEGISPVYMNPSFPSVTFPNHYTLVTGLYPESHGVVGNTFWDAELKEEFFYTDALAMQPKWWGGEPLWVTAENQGIRTAVHMWPGSEAHILGVEPAFLDTFNGEELLDNKVSRVLELLDKPGEEDEVAEVVDMRPQFIAAYVPNVDADGHLYGPNSTEIKTTINQVDTMLDQLFQGLEERNLTSIVNVVVVSDHGMATTDTNRLIQLDDLIDINLIEHSDGWPLYGLRPKNPADLQGMYDTLAITSAQNQNFEVYLRDENMPERYHFTKNERIAPLWIVPKTGWAIVTKGEFNVADAKEQGLAYHPKGLHGYDHEHPLMRAIFIARGPAFPHAPNSRVEPFQNIEVYNIICDSLGLDPKPNNGTLRLPLKPVGIHTPETTPEDPSDPEPSPSPASDAGSDAIISISPVEASSAADPNVVPPTMIGVDQPEEVSVDVISVDQPVEVSVDRPVVGDETEVAAEDKKFFDWIKGKLGEVKDWFKELGGGDGEKEGEGESGE
ncbi:putative pyrophosphatase/phosphodiesterase [Lachnellula willkommii]|uniref:Putative pyrophosphatase/phosphodiesterase n=1 Tax=Lachnellula willkommii TaxID=215461 RepID=A0A559M919_9HELO|nr:putative pyrophosphatase/phosphodiesterase [Lachnellula willkommii]